jgi:hypothetical protein
MQLNIPELSDFDAFMKLFNSLISKFLIFQLKLKDSIVDNQVFEKNSKTAGIINYY